MNTLGIKTNDDMCLLISGVKSKLNTEGEVTDEELVKKLIEFNKSFEENLIIIKKKEN